MLTTLVENHEKDISNITDSLGNILVQIEEIENRPVPTTTQAPTFNGPLSKYSCNKITKTWIQISRQNWKDFYSNISHQRLVSRLNKQTVETM